MSLNQKHRSALYQGLTQVVDDEEAVSEMLAHIPARDLDEPITRDHLRAEMVQLRADLTAEMAQVRHDVTEGDAAIRSEMAAAMGSLRAELSAEMRRWFLATIALMLTLAGIVASLS